jgi:CHAD domain-containing protein
MEKSGLFEKVEDQSAPERMNKAQRLEWDEKAGASANAEKCLPALVAGYFQKGREILANNPAPPELHALRLATKSLRYTLELFLPCYGPGLVERLDALRGLQQVLGEISDTAAAARLVDCRNSAEAKTVKTFLEMRRAAKSEEFRKRWTEFDAPGKERWWTHYLAHNARKGCVL